MEADLFIGGGNEMPLTASCNAGDLATGGGYAYPATSTFTIKASYPHFSGSGWTVTFDNGGTDALVTAFVRCAELTP